MVDEAQKTKWYFSDGLDVYALLWYHLGRYAVSEGKTDTFSVEADNAELRHYLARLARSSRCPFALANAIRLFVYHYGLYPKYNFHSLISFTHSFSHSVKTFLVFLLD